MQTRFIPNIKIFFERDNLFLFYLGSLVPTLELVTNLCNFISLLFRDNIPTVVIAEWDLAAELFSGDPLAGLVPTLFAENSVR